MSSDHPDEVYEPRASTGSEPSHDNHAADHTTVVVHGEAVSDQGALASAKAPVMPKDSPKEATVLVRGETVRGNNATASASGSQSKSPTNESPSKDASKDSSADKDSSARKAPAKEVSPAKVKRQSRLPALEDDAQVGVQKDHVVTRDGKADLAFTGTLLASAAPETATKGKWQEYRIYSTNGGKHVFSKVTRSVYVEDRDVYQAEIFDPSPSSMPSQLLRSARDLTRSHPMTWSDAAVGFFGYDPLAKALYRKVGGQFEEHIS